MAKCYCRDPDENRRKLLFGDPDAPVKLERMSKAVKIEKSTLYRYRKYPSMIPLDRLSRIIRWRGLTDEEIGELFK